MGGHEEKVVTAGRMTVSGASRGDVPLVGA